jgi:hypothetical protein
MNHTRQLRSDYTGVKVFSATMAQERARLGERLSDWIQSRPELEVVDTVVTQSSDASFHCLAFTVFYRERLDRA